MNAARPEAPADACSPFSPAALAEPGSAYAELHARVPVYRCTDFEPPFYLLSRHADVGAALRDIETYSSEFGQGPRFTPPAGMLSDPPQHTLFRSLVQQAFTPRAIDALGGRIERLADELLDDCAHRGDFDLHDDFAFPLPVIVIAEMLGVPAADLHLFKHWSDASVAAMGSERPEAYAADLGAMADYLRARVGEARAPGVPSSLITALVQAEVDGRRLADDEILSVLTQLLVGGNETTTSLITNAVWRLLERPPLWRRLADDAALVPAAVEESLRFDPPVLGLFRNTTRPVTLHGVEIPAGSKVMLHYGAANRDPEAFADADTFSLDRPPKRHLAFGLGVHFCLGAQLARLEGRIALTRLVTRFPDLTLLDAGERIAPFFLWGRRRLPVRAQPPGARP
ncbi:MAG: cytochrome P450 [Pseudomonadales bacterium]